MRLHTVTVFFLALSSYISAQEAQTPLFPDYTCEEPPYKMHIVSHSPLVIYITDFLTQFERSHLQAISESTFSHSSITGPQSHDARIRTSQSTTVPHSDAVVGCISRRALALQGFPQESHLEPLQLVRYGPGQHFHFHTDWFPPSSSSPTTPSPHAALELGGNRLTSNFAYVKVENGTTGGGTNFPMLRAEELGDEKWCGLGWVDCDEEWDRGVTFRPVEGNAVFWVNLLADGRGDERTLHAGLPVTTGRKVGMNIWRREGRVSESVRGGGG